MVTSPHSPDPNDDNPIDLPVEPDTGPGIPGLPGIPDDPEHDRPINARD